MFLCLEKHQELIKPKHRLMVLVTQYKVFLIKLFLIVGSENGFAAASMGMTMSLSGFTPWKIQPLS